MIVGSWFGPHPPYHLHVLLRLILDTPWMRELSVAEQRYQAVLAVITGGGLGDRSHRPRARPDQMASVVEVAVVELRRAHPSWEPRRIHYELARREVLPVEALPSDSAVYRCLVRHGRIAPEGRRERGQRMAHGLVTTSRTSCELPSAAICVMS